MNSEKLATISNMFSMLASIPIVWLPGYIIGVSYVIPTSLVFSFFVLLLTGYLLARKIDGCLIPFRRVIYIWSLWGSMLGVVMSPVSYLIEYGYNHIVWGLVVLYLPFVAIFFITKYSIANFGRKNI